MGDPIFDTYYSSTVPVTKSTIQQESAVQVAGAALLDRIGRPVMLLAHSQGGIVCWGIADVRPDLVQAIVAIEPGGPPFRDVAFGNNAPARPYGLTNIPIAYSPPVNNPETDFVKQTIPSGSSEKYSCVIQADDPKPRQLANIRNIPVLVLTTEASYHAQYDYCTARFLQQAGVETEHIQLEDIGIRGNGHMVFMERNSDRVASVIREWIESTRRLSKLGNKETKDVGDFVMGSSQV